MILQLKHGMVLITNHTLLLQGFAQFIWLQGWAVENTFIIQNKFHTTCSAETTLSKTRTAEM